MTTLVRLATGGPLVRPVWPMIAAVALLAVVIAISPLTLVSVVVLAAIVAGAGHGLTGAERRAVLTLLLVAIAIRVAMVGWLFLVSHPGHIISFSFDGDGLWVKRRALWIRNVWLGIPIHTRQLEDAYTLYGWSSWIYVLAYLQYLLGESPYAVHLVSVCCFVGSAVLLHRAMRVWFGQIAALVALAVILFLPSWLMWSVAAMRESFYFLGLTLFVVACVRAMRGPNDRARVAAIAGTVASVWLMGTMRNGAFVIVAAAVLLAMMGTFVTRRGYLLLLTLVLIVPVSSLLIDLPVVQKLALPQIHQAATAHRGNALEIGHGYKLLDERFYTRYWTAGGRYEIPWVQTVKTMTWDEAKRFVGRSVIAYLIVPLPWQVATPLEKIFIPEQMLWYVLLALCAIGVVRGLRTDVLATWALLALIVVSSALAAPNEGNVGTLIRHRDTVVPFLACLSAVGVLSLLRWAGLRDRRPDVVSCDNGLDREPSRFRRLVDASVFARMLAGSAAVGAGAALLRPTIGYERGAYSAVHRYSIEALTPWLERSSIASLFRRMAKLAVGTWTGSAVVRATGALVADVRAHEASVAIRLCGTLFLVALLIGGPISLALNSGWPVVVVWAATVLLTGAVVTCAPLLGRALAQKRASNGGALSLELAV